MSAMRVAVAGAGFMAAVHTRAARGAGAHLVAEVHPDGEKGRSAAESFGADRGYPFLDDALDHADAN
ncbi:hypothetical protein ABZY42_09685 [Streptomyces sp. NPDC006622]|uniref:hypothetical protein n=1 Tax=Streptomyces sp. NPDC006622 TaxID=3155459 RepID=UPI0033A57969